MMQQWCMMIPLFHLDICKYQTFGLAKLVSPLSDSVHPQHQGSQGHLFRDISLLLERTLRVAKRSSVQLQESFSSCIMLYYSPGKHDIPPENECRLPNLPTTLGGLFHVSSQEGIYHVDSSIVQPPFILRSIGHNRVGSCWCIQAKDRCEMWGHLGSILLVKSQFMGSKPNTSTKTYSVVFHPHLYLQLPEMFGHLRRLPTQTRPCMLRATCRRQDDTHCCQATCIDFDTHSFCLLTQPTTKLSQGNDVVALSTSKRTPKEIETSENEKHVETLDRLGLEPQGTRWVHPAKQTTQGFHEKHPQEMTGC